MPTERRLRLRSEVYGPLAPALFILAVLYAGIVVWLRPVLVAAGVGAAIAAWVVAKWPRRLPAVILRAEGVEVRHSDEWYDVAWSDVRDLALMRRGPTRPVRIVCACATATCSSSTRSRSPSTPRGAPRPACARWPRR